MTHLYAKILMNKAGEGDGGGAPNPPPPTPPQDPATPPANPPPPAADGKTYDDLGYEIVEKKGEGEPPKAGDKSKEDPSKKSEKVENPVTGYGEDIKVDDPPPPDPNKKVDPPPDLKGLDKELEDLSKVNKQAADKAKAQIEKLKLSDDQRKEFIAAKMQEQKDAADWNQNYQQEMARQERVRNAGWQKELKEDPVFGKEKYPVNIARSEKVLDEYLPELKKELTDAKQMLRPSVMRGLMRIADSLYPDDKLIQGDPPPPVEDKGGGKDAKIDPLAFYE